MNSWTADNGDGTYTNPLFYDEFSDPDLIRIDDDFYMTGTTMHVMPGLPILHSKDLVNWEIVGHVFDRLDLGPEFRLEEGKNIYGQGIWAPCLRYHNGVFHVFSNINGHSTQLFTALNPAGPWKHVELKRSFHDLSILFDDDGKVYVVCGYRDVHLAQLTEDLIDIVPGSERIIIQHADDDARDMGEGMHFYKIDGKYYIFSAWWKGRMRMPCARADRPEGPYEVNPEISADEDFGLAEGNRLANERNGCPFDLLPPDPKRVGRMSMHQGGIVDTKSGQWWGFSMMDYNSVGRLVCLSPITWKDGWPYYGLPGNLGRTPRTWTKPDTGFNSQPSIPYQRSDHFNSEKLQPIWQWNHLPDDSKWSLIDRPGFLRLHSLPAADFWNARNSLTQRAIGPISTATVELEVGGLQCGDVAGLALLNYPYTWIGVQREGEHYSLVRFDQTTNQKDVIEFFGTKVWLRADCDFLREKAVLLYSLDGVSFQTLGNIFTMIFQGRTFQGIRYALFNYNLNKAAGGYADFDSFHIYEPHPRGLMQPIPYGQQIAITAIDGDLSLVVADKKLSAQSTLAKSSRFLVTDRSQGRVALVAGGQYISVNKTGDVVVKAGEPSDSETFQWVETPYGDLTLLSVRTHRLLTIDPFSHKVTAMSPGPRPDRKDGTWLRWKIISEDE